MWQLGLPRVTTAEARSLYDCLKAMMRAGYARSGNRIAAAFADWKVYNSRPYVAQTHAARYVNNYANAAAKAYGRFEKAGRMPPGAVLAKDSFSVDANGQGVPGPLFLMEKMARGFNAASGDWRYSMIMPSGRVVGVTKGRGSATVKFCHECHMSVAESQDSMMLIPEEARIN